MKDLILLQFSCNAFGKKYLLVSIVFLAVLQFYSCTKDTIQDTTQQQELPNYKRLDQPLTQIIENSQNEADEKIRRVQLIFGEAMAELFKNQGYVRMAVEDTKNSPLETADFNRLRNANHSFKNDLDELLAKHIQLSGFFDNKTEEEDPYAFLVNQLVYDTIYEAKIYIPNLATMDINLDAIISSGLDLEDGLEYEDAIWAKEYDAYTQKLIDIILTEQQALSSQKPVLIFNNGENEDQYAGKQIFGEENAYSEVSNKNEEALTYKQFAYNNVSIKSESYHYDGCCKNEYACTALYVTNDNNQWGWIYSSGGDLSKTVTRFTKSECNGQDKVASCEFFYDSSHFPHATGDCIVFFNTFERDWYYSPKDLGEYSHNGNATVWLVGKRKYASEWYLSANGNILVGVNMNIGSSSNIESDKSKFRITRVQ